MLMAGLWVAEVISGGAGGRGNEVACIRPETSGLPSATAFVALVIEPAARGLQMAAIEAVSEFPVGLVAVCAALMLSPTSCP